jgi:Cdc6-like AAA superfamily ATPase
MKNYSFEHYIHNIDNINIHPKIESLIKKMPMSVENVPNIIIYGPPGVGKYSQSLNLIKQYSNSDLKYEKKMIVSFNKENYFYKISDSHFEIDMELLGCNSKLLFHAIYDQIVDVISSRSFKNGIILCKNFHKIHSDLLESFYSYLQNSKPDYLNISFILLTEHLSFLPNNILNCCIQLNIGRPTKTAYKKCFPKMNNKVIVNEINNMRNLDQNINDFENLYLKLATKFMDFYKTYNTINFINPVFFCFISIS